MSCWNLHVAQHWSAETDMLGLNPQSFMGTCTGCPNVPTQHRTGRSDGLLSSLLPAVETGWSLETGKCIYNHCETSEMKAFVFPSAVMNVASGMAVGLRGASRSTCLSSPRHPWTPSPRWTWWSWAQQQESLPHICRAEQEPSACPTSAVRPFIFTKSKWFMLYLTFSCFPWCI